MLVLVLGLLLISYASSMRAFLDQRHHLAGLRASISTSQAAVDRLSREQTRWRDPAFVRTVARQRFGWVLPGEIGFQVIDDNGKPLGHTDSLPPSSSSATAARPLWWQSTWGSVVTAGRTQTGGRSSPPPVTTINAPAPGKAHR